jgi:hypothetical protein
MRGSRRKRIPSDQEWYKKYLTRDEREDLQAEVAAWRNLCEAAEERARYWQRGFERASAWAGHLEEKFSKETRQQTWDEFFGARLLKERAQAIEEDRLASFEAEQLEREREAERRRTWMK